MHNKKEYYLLRMVEVCIGIGLGTGFLTSLRFMGFIGISEILFMLSVSVLGYLYGKSLFKFRLNIASIFKAILLFSFLIVAPLATAIVYFLTGLNGSPEYIFSFTMGVILMFLLSDGISHGLKFQNVVIWFAFCFCFIGVLGVYVFPLNENGRYTAGAMNPNQLLFYGSSLTLMLSMYKKVMLVVLFPIVTYIMILTKSDAYLLTLFMLPILFFYFRFFYVAKVGFFFNVLFWLTLFVVLLMLISEQLEFLLLAWDAADEGGGRLNLYKNAFLATLESPIFGLGYGSFSGFDSPFEGQEAHNTFLDLSMQFGFIVPIFLYGLILSFLFLVIKKKEFLVASFVVLYILSGTFHFYARHFVFWVELAIFYSYLNSSRIQTLGKR